MLIVILALLNICVKHKFSPKLIFLMFGMEGKLQAVWIGFRTFNVIDVTCFRDPKCCLSQLRFAPIVCMHSFFFPVLETVCLTPTVTIQYVLVFATLCSIMLQKYFLF